MIAALLLAAICGLAATGAADAKAATLTPRAAGDYRDSVGVQLHTDFSGYAYDTESGETLGSLLRTVGIHHVRDSACVSGGERCAEAQAKLASLRGALGPDAPTVELMLLTTAELATTPGRAERDAQIQRALRAAASDALRSMVAGIEGVNEPDLKGTAGWEQITAADEATTDALLERPEFASLRGARRLSPAMGRGASTAALLAAGWRPRSGQTGNFHPYPPAWGGPEHGLTVACGDALVTDCVRRLGDAASAPIATESGYSTTGGAISTSWVSERAQATYLPRLLLENFDRGIERTYLYELIDLDPAGTYVNHGYGLWRARRTSAGIGVGAAKPAADAIARLHAVIGDLGRPATSLAPIDLELTSGGRPVAESAVRRTLLQRADGSYVLALWQPKAVFDNTVFRQRELTVPDVSVDLALPGRWSVAAYRPSASAGTIASAGSTSTFTAQVGADVTLLDLRPQGGAAAPNPAPPAGQAPVSDAAPAPAAAPTAGPVAVPAVDLDAALRQVAGALAAAFAPRAPSAPATLAPVTGVPRLPAAAAERSKAKAKAKAKSQRAKVKRAKAKRAKARANAKARAKARAGRRG